MRTHSDAIWTSVAPDTTCPETYRTNTANPETYRQAGCVNQPAPEPLTSTNARPNPEIAVTWHESGGQVRCRARAGQWPTGLEGFGDQVQQPGLDWPRPPGAGPGHSAPTVISLHRPQPLPARFLQSSKRRYRSIIGVEGDTSPGWVLVLEPLRPRDPHIRVEVHDCRPAVQGPIFTRLALSVAEHW